MFRKQGNIEIFRLFSLKYGKIFFAFIPMKNLLYFFNEMKSYVQYYFNI